MIYHLTLLAIGIIVVSMVIAIIISIVKFILNLFKK